MEWKTRLTELLGCEYPILEGGLSAFGFPELAASVSNAGAHGTITAGAYHTPEGLRKGIRKYRELSDKPFSVNISITHCRDEEGMPMNKWIPKASALFLKADKWKAASYEGPEESGAELERVSTLFSEAVATIDDIPTCQELIDSMVKGAEDLLNGYDFLKSWKQGKN